MLYETGLGAASLARWVLRGLLEHRFVVATVAIIEDAPWAEKMVETTQPGLSGLLVQSFAQVRAGLSRGLKLVPIAPQAGALPARPLSFPRAVRPGRTRQSGSYMCLRSAKLGKHMKVAGIYRLELGRCLPGSSPGLQRVAVAPPSHPTQGSRLIWQAGRASDGGKVISTR